MFMSLFQTITPLISVSICQYLLINYVTAINANLLSYTAWEHDVILNTRLSRPLAIESELRLTANRLFV